jgi:hypothetical protein
MDLAEQSFETLVFGQPCPNLRHKGLGNIDGVFLTFPHGCYWTLPGAALTIGVQIHALLAAL